MKKKVVLYGNCHTGVIKRYLETCKEFNQFYEICPIEQIQDVKDPSYFEQEIFKTCDVFIHQSIRENNRYGKEFSSANIISKLKADCKVIAIPNVYHLPVFLYPQYSEEKELRYNNQTYFFRDKIIDSQFKKGVPVKKIAETYYNYEFDRDDIVEGYNKFLEKVRIREKDWDIKVSDFIQGNIQNERLFYEMNHPTNFFIKYCTIGILKILLEGEFSIGEIEKYRMDTYEMPILNCVANALGLNYSTDGKELRVSGNKLLLKPMFIKDYIKQYIATIWIAYEDFDEKLVKKSKRKYFMYKCVNFLLRVARKLLKIGGLAK